MLEDFLKKYQLVGMSKKEVIELLGEEGMVKSYKDTYYIGKGFIGPILLTLIYDENNNVKNYSIVVD